MSVQYLGDYHLNDRVRFRWDTQGASGESITRGTNGTILIYKNTATGKRTATTGHTDTEDADGKTGVHWLEVTTSSTSTATADADFFAAGSEYWVHLDGAVIDGKTVNSTLAMFSIEKHTKKNVVKGIVTSGGTTTSIPTSFLSSTASVTDQFKGRIVIFDADTTTAALRNQASDITGSSSGGTLTVSTLSTAPASGDTFRIF